MTSSTQNHGRSENYREFRITPAIIEEALQYDLGTEAKRLVVQCIQQKYGMNFELVGQYHAEFENYLRELLHESAEIIISRIKGTIKDQKNTLEMSTPALGRRRLAGTAHFVFCDQCYWSASLLTATHELKCKSCNCDINCALPIFGNEAFRYEVGDKRGLTLFFS